jgi:hypothetical protein
MKKRFLSFLIVTFSLVMFAGTDALAADMKGDRATEKQSSRLRGSTGAQADVEQQENYCSAEYAYCGPFDMDPGDGGSGGGGGGGWGGGGCQYCYWDSQAPYANCFTSSSSLPYPKYSNCYGTRYCWRDGSGAEYCEPRCSGSYCYYT